MKTPTVPLDTLPPRDRILQTAARLFYAEGVQAVGIDRILAESQSAKASLYRWFPSKDDLVQAYLRLRHERWMDWFTGRLQVRAEQHGLAFERVAEVLGEWFAEPDFRGCAFINAWSSGALAPAAASVAQSHKQELQAALLGLAAALGHPAPAEAAADALLVVEGAIVRAHMAGGDEAVAAARRLLRRLDDATRWR